MHDLLEDPLIGIRTKNVTSRVSLPELLARLSKGEVEGYTGLRPHQADPWHVFLVQVAASILARHPEISSANPPVDVEFWRAGLLDLAEGKTSAWHLVVEDVRQPAFLQHPLASAEEIANNFKPKAAAPDELDVLVTAKNHDVKMARVASETFEAWLFALLTYQTTSGYLGRGNYGIARMYSGTGSRPIVTIVSNLFPSIRFREELSVVCDMRPQLVSSALQYVSHGVVLTWLRSWNRQQHQYQIGQSELEPFFIEASRPIRLTSQLNEVIALGATSEDRQIGPRSMDTGDVGDPWIPVVEGERRHALNPSKNGWTTELITNMLFRREISLTPLQEPRKGSRDLWFTGSVLARGKNPPTNGFHRFELPIPAKASGWLIAADKRETMGELAQELIKAAKAAEKALTAALMALTEGGPEEVNFKADSVGTWTSKTKTTFTRAWEDSFFKTLWRAADEDSDKVRRDWGKSLVELASQILRDAEGALPMPHARRYRALVTADRILFGSLRKSGLIQIDTKEAAA